MEATSLTVTGAAVTGVEVMGAGSNLLLKSCSVQSLIASKETKHCQRIRECTDVRGVFVHHAAHAELHDVSVSDCQWGVFTCDGATTIMKRCSVSVTDNACASFRSGGAGSASECKFSASKRAHGLEVSCRGADAGTRVQLSKCMLFRNRQAGAAVFGPGEVHVHDCHTRENGASGFWAHDKGVLEASGCSSEEDKVGFGASGCSRIEVVQCKVSRSAEESFLLKGGCAGKMTDCSSNGAGASAILVSGKSTRAEIVGCQIENCGANGVHVGANSVCELDLCTVKTVSYTHLTLPTKA